MFVLKSNKIIFKNVSGESYVTASVIFRVIKILENEINCQGISTDNTNHDDDISPQLKTLFFKTITNVLLTRYKIILQFCTVLDPSLS